MSHTHYAVKDMTEVSYDSGIVHVIEHPTLLSGHVSTKMHFMTVFARLKDRAMYINCSFLQRTLLPDSLHAD